MKMSSTKELVEIKSEGSEPRVCRGCLATDLPLFDLRSESLAQAFGDFTGIPVLPSDPFPQQVCAMCKYLLAKFRAFRARCHSAMCVLQQLVQEGVEISAELISTLDTSLLKPNLRASNIQIVGSDYIEDVTTKLNVVDTLSNIPPANKVNVDTLSNIPAVNNVSLINKDSKDDLHLLLDGNNFHIATLVIENSGETDKKISYGLSDNEEWPPDIEFCELPMTSEGVDKENVICKRPNKKVEKKDDKVDIDVVKIEDSDGDDDSVISVLSKSDEWPSESKLNDCKLPTKRKRVKKENITCDRPNKVGKKDDKAAVEINDSGLKNSKKSSVKKTKGKTQNKDADKQQDVIIRVLADIMVSARYDSRAQGDSYTSLWELVYQQSLQDDHPCLVYEDLSQLSLPQKINQYLFLSKKLAALMDCELRFSCLAEQKKEIEDRRVSAKYQKAPFKCELCCKHYIFEDTYRRHMMSHDPAVGDVVCEICQYRFKNHRRFVTHYHNSHTKTLVCKRCGAVSWGWTIAKHHFRWHGGAGAVCEPCGKTFSDKKLYYMHVRAIHRATQATELCLLCGDTYNGAAGLGMHTRKAHRECPQCLTCTTRFASAEALATHKAESGTGCHELSACPVCGHNFPSEHSMREHYDTLHKKEQFKCDQCGRVMQTLTQYTRHLKPCLARIQQRGGRKRAARATRRPRTAAAGDAGAGKSLMCELCGKGNFTCAAYLREHQRTHTGEKPFECDYCGKKFMRMQLLRIHIVTHTDERRYKCPHCPKAFRQQPHLGAHILSHTKERPYSCNLCDKSYAGLGTLKQHKDTVHRGLPPRQRDRGRRGKAEPLGK